LKNLLAILLLYICQSSNAQSQTSDFLVTNISKDFNFATSGFRDVFIDQLRRKWIASTNAGLSMFDGRKIHRYTTQDGMSSDFVFRVSQDSEGSIWAATANGLSCLDQTGKY
jgi:ligand-binding sensor domain-containing protein